MCLHGPQAVLIGGEDNLPVWLSRTTIPGTEIIIDPCAAIIVIIATALLCAGVKEVYFMIIVCEKIVFYLNLWFYLLERDGLFVNVYKEKYVFSGCIPGNFFIFLLFAFFWHHWLLSKVVIWSIQNDHDNAIELPKGCSS